MLNRILTGLALAAAVASSAAAQDLPEAIEVDISVIELTEKKPRR